MRRHSAAARSRSHRSTRFLPVLRLVGDFRAARAQPSGLRSLFPSLHSLPEPAP
eukprot:SAG22_NODE_16719_length_319_cov_1.036364_1_plen_53_part_10